MSLSYVTNTQLNTTVEKIKSVKEIIESGSGSSSLASYCINCSDIELPVSKESVVIVSKENFNEFEQALNNLTPIILQNITIDNNYIIKYYVIPFGSLNINDNSRLVLRNFNTYIYDWDSNNGVRVLQGYEFRILFDELDDNKPYLVLYNNN